MCKRFLVVCALLAAACEQSPTGAWVTAPAPVQAPEAPEALRVNAHTRATWTQLHAAQLEGDRAPTPTVASTVPADELALRARLAHDPTPTVITMPATVTGGAR